MNFTLKIRERKKKEPLQSLTLWHGLTILAMWEAETGGS